MLHSTDLVKYCKEQVGKPYWFGTFGQIATKELLNSKKRQYPSYYTASDFNRQIGKRVHDCSGLIKGALCHGVYNSKYDLSAASMYSTGSEKGKIDSIPEVPGVLVFKGSSQAKIHHVGVYIGDGRIIEAKGHAYGVVESKLDKTWKYWAKCKFIDYGKKESTAVKKPKIDPASYFDKGIAGTYKAKSNDTEIRAGACSSKQLLLTIKKKTKVQCYGYYSKKGKEKWLMVICDKVTGFVKASDFERV